MFTTRHTLSMKIAIPALLALVAAPLLAAITGAPSSAAYAQGKSLAIGTQAATTAPANLLDQPSTAGRRVAQLPVNAQASVLGGPFNEGWYWVDYSGTNGYLDGRQLVPVDADYKPVPTATPSPVATTQPAVTPSPTAVPVSSVQTSPGNYAGLWLGELAVASNVRNAPAGKVIKSWWVGRRVLLYQTVADARGGLWYRVSETPEAPMYVAASAIRKVAPVQFEAARFPGKWVNVNVTQQVVTAYDNGTPVMVTLASTGTATNPTDLGVQRILWKVPSREMIGGSIADGDYYDLPNVPFPQYFNNTGEALHGTYWHDNFGRPMSHGCVNLSTPIAQWFYNWATIGTVVYVHY